MSRTNRFWRGALLASWAICAGCSPATPPDAELGAPLATLPPLGRDASCPPSGPCLEPFAAPVLIRRDGPQRLWLRGWDLGSAGDVELAGASVQATSWSADRVLVELSAPVTGGDGTIRLVVGGVPSNALATVVAPVVTSTTPAPAGNTTVLVKGDGFGEAPGEVWLTNPGNLIGQVKSWTPTSIEVFFQDFSPDQVTQLFVVRRITHQGRDLGRFEGVPYAWGQP